MDVWVRSEYAGELAVLSAWLTALVPWSVSYVPRIAGGSILDVRFPFLQVRYAFDLPIGRAVTIRDPLTGVALTQGTPAGLAYIAWAVGAAVVVLALLLSVVYYTREARVETAPIDPVRAMGALLLLAGGVFGAATALFVTRFPGFTVPVGAVFVFLFGVVLLLVERAEVTGETDESAAEADASGD